MNFGLDLSFLIPIDFWDYMLYTAFFVMLALIPAILSFRYNNETSLVQVLFSVVGLSGFVYSLFKAWATAPGSLHYLIFTGVSIVLAILAGTNFLIKSECNEGVSSNECFISLSGFFIFAILAFISVLKAWFVIPPDGFMDYLRFACIWSIFALICAGILVILKFTHNNFEGDMQIFGGLGFFFLMEMIYSLQKTWDSMPDDLKFEIIVAVGIIIFLVAGGTGGAVSAGASGYKSE